MKNKLNTSKDIFFYSRSRQNTTRNIFSSVLFICVAVIISFLIIPIGGLSIQDSLNKIINVLTSQPKSIIIYATWFGIAALSFMFSYKLGLFNIGISGQMLGGGLFVFLGAYSFYSSGKLPSGSEGLLLSFVLAILGGMLVSLVIGVLKVFFNVHEVISSIMMNWIMFFLVEYAVLYWIPQSDQTTNIVGSYTLPEQFAIYDSSNPWSSAIWDICLFVFISLIILVILKYTIFGKKIDATGSSLTASKYSGYNTKKLQLSAFLISGAISGVLAMIVYTSFPNQLILDYSKTDVVPTQGFDGIAISLIALNNPIAIIPVSFLMSIVKSASAFGAVTPEFSSMMLSIIIYGAAIFSLAIYLKPWIWIMQSINKRYNKQAYYNYVNDMIILVNKIKKGKNVSRKKIVNTISNKILTEKKLKYYSVKMKKENINQETLIILCESKYEKNWKRNKEILMLTINEKNAKFSLFIKFKILIVLAKNELMINHDNTELMQNELLILLKHNMALVGKLKDRIESLEKSKTDKKSFKNIYNEYKNFDDSICKNYLSEKNINLKKYYKNLVLNHVEEINNISNHDEIKKHKLIKKAHNRNNKNIMLNEIKYNIFTNFKKENFKNVFSIIMSNCDPIIKVKILMLMFNPKEKCNIEMVSKMIYSNIEQLETEHKDLQLNIDKKIDKILLENFTNVKSEKIKCNKINSMINRTLIKINDDNFRNEIEKKLSVKVDK